MSPQKDRKFLRVADRADMRVILAAELGKTGADNPTIYAMDGVIREEAADVLVSDDNDEMVLLHLRELGVDGRPVYLLVIEGGLRSLDSDAACLIQ